MGVVRRRRRRSRSAGRVDGPRAATAALLKHAQQADSVLANCVSRTPLEHRCGCEVYVLRDAVAPRLDAATLEWAYDLCRRNMAQLYTDVWGWNAYQKRRQLAANKSRFLLIRHQASGELQGYVNFRFEEDDGQPIVYCFELQLEQAGQGRGLGTFLMAALEVVAKDFGMQQVILTVLTANTIACKFYERLLYVDKEHLVKDGGDDPGYRILHKTLSCNNADAVL